MWLRVCVCIIAPEGEGEREYNTMRSVINIYSLESHHILGNAKSPNQIKMMLKYQFLSWSFIVVKLYFAKCNGFTVFDRHIKQIEHSLSRLICQTTLDVAVFS